MSSKSCEIANCILLYAFTRDIETVSNAVEAGQLPLVSLLGAKVLPVLHTRPQRRGIMRPAVVFRLWAFLDTSAAPR
jgi:hypothetical protein